VKPEYTLLGPEHGRNEGPSVSSIQIHEGHLDKRLWLLIFDMAGGAHLHAKLRYSGYLDLLHSNAFSGNI
jgi:hypothetical protein